MTELEFDIYTTRKSKEHWQRMRDDRTCGDEMGTVDCPLCQLYHPKDCEGCPIAEFIGDSGCTNTLYSEALRAFRRGTDKAWEAAADEMIAFLDEVIADLESRLPKRPITPTVLREARIILPVFGNDGKSLADVHQRLRIFLAMEFEGYTSFSGFGGWMNGASLQEEQIRIYDVAVEGTSEDHLKLLYLCQRLREDAKQDAIYLRDSGGNVHIIID